MFTEVKLTKIFIFIFLSLAFVFYANNQAYAQGSELDDKRQMQKNIYDTTPDPSELDDKRRQKENIYPSTGASSNILDNFGALEAISGVVARLVNLATWAIGIVFVGMLLITAIKYAMAQGDPKGLEGAKNTLTYAVFGLLVAIGFFAISGIVARGVGQEGLLTNPAGKLEDNIVALRKKLTELGNEKWYRNNSSDDTGTEDSGYVTTEGEVVDPDEVLLIPGSGEIYDEKRGSRGTLLYKYENLQSWEEDFLPNQYPELDSWENSTYDVWCDGKGSCNDTLNPANVKVAEYALESGHAIDLQGDGVWFNEKRGVVVESYDFVGEKIDGRPITGQDSQGCWQYLDELGTTYCD